MSFTDAADWTRPIVFVSDALATSDFPDWSEGVAVVPNQGASVGGSAGWYGDGSDGTATMDGSTTVAGMAPAGNVYTMTRDCYFASLTVNNGVTLKTNGMRVLCSATLTNNGTIGWDGTSTTTVNGAVAPTNNSCTINTSGIAGNGGAGGSTSGGGGGGATSPVNASLGQNGGAGGAGSAGNGGSGSTQVLIPVQHCRSLPHAAYGHSSIGSTFYSGVGSGGGGGGGGGGTSQNGGGGGSGGPMIIVLALAIAGTGTITAKGGNGANGVGTNCGGGGGGGGGTIIVVSGSVSNGAVAGQTLNVTGGNPGNGTGTGHAGTAGQNGFTILLAA